MGRVAQGRTTTQTTAAPARGGWWLYPNRSDIAVAYGPPGVHVLAGGIGVTPGPDPNGPLAQANANWDGTNFPGYNPYAVPLGAYASTQSPYGLLDVSGGTKEWTEETIFINGVFPAYRVFDGSAWDTPQSTQADLVNGFGGDFPSLSTSDLGFRIATIPTPPTCIPMGILLWLNMRRRRKRGIYEQACCDRRSCGCVRDIAARGATAAALSLPTPSGHSHDRWDAAHRQEGFGDGQAEVHGASSGRRQCSGWS